MGIIIQQDKIRSLSFKKMINSNILLRMKNLVIQNYNHFYKFIINAQFLQKKVQMILRISRKV